MCFCLRAKAVKIIDPDTGVAVGPNVVGEITYKSDYPMLGYLNHPEENERFFGKDGFLHSGDLGHYDEAGNLYFDGRLKELIKYKNFHLYPNELEELLMAHEGVEVWLGLKRIWLFYPPLCLVCLSMVVDAEVQIKLWLL